MNIPTQAKTRLEWGTLPSNIKLSLAASSLSTIVRWIEKASTLTAAEYLQELTTVYKRYTYLMEILQTRHEWSISGRLDRSVADEDIPRYARELARSSVANLITLMPKEKQEAIEADVARYLAGRKPELGWAARAHRAFLQRASDTAREIFSSIDIAVGNLPTASFNASAIPVPGSKNSWVVALNDGVSALVYEVARTTAATLKIRVGQETDSEALSDLEAGRILYERFNCYVHLGVPYGSEYKVSPKQVFVASRVTTMAERFVYAHELAHIILHHHDHAALRALPGDWSGAQQTIQRPDQEIEADILAWQLLARVFAESGADLQTAYAGSSLFLKAADILEGAEDLTAVGTHPPARERLEFLHEAVHRTATELGVAFEQITAIGKGMSNGLERAIEAAPPLPGACPFEELLDRASSSIIPDYMSFQDEVLAMLSHSAPSKLCRVLGRAMGRAERDLRKLGIIDESATNQDRTFDEATISAGRKPFAKFKLVAGLLGLYLTPEIGRFIERYRAEYLEECDD